MTNIYLTDCLAIPFPSCVCARESTRILVQRGRQCSLAHRGESWEGGRGSGGTPVRGNGVMSGNGRGVGQGQRWEWVEGRREGRGGKVGRNAKVRACSMFEICIATRGNRGQRSEDRRGMVV